MSVLNIDNESRRFSFEVLPPLKGTGTEKLFADIDKLREFDPAYINITTHQKNNRNGKHLKLLPPPLSCWRKIPSNRHYNTTMSGTEKSPTFS
jgi:hypothetical protein